jgi:hypothetical protein
MKRLDATHIDPMVRAEFTATESAFTAGPAKSTPAPFELPTYLVKHYAWAYIWPNSVWFFDHQPIINSILFGNYRKIMRNTMRMMDTRRAGRTLQVAGVYGELTPSLAADIGATIGRTVECTEQVDIFRGFYRVMQYSVK